MSIEDGWLSAWAKTGRDPFGGVVVTGWLPLHEHLADAAAVAGLLVERWVSSQVVSRIARGFGGDLDDVWRLAVWLAAVHDVGKASPAFAVQVPELARVMCTRGLVVSPALKDDPDRRAVRHEFVGQLTVRYWLADTLGFARRGAAAQLACVVGSHHGVPPTHVELGRVRDRPDLAGRGEWLRAREAILVWATEIIGGPGVLRRYADVLLGRPEQALLTAIVIMADWIASNVELFPLDPLRTASGPPRRPDPERTAARVAHGWAALNLPPHWSAQPFDDIETAFRARFGRDPRPVQIAATEAAHAQHEPGLLIVEAPMGEGKTEAALLAAEALAARSGADGCFVALPTRATSDAMFPRVMAWMRAVPGLVSGASVMLAHGTASLNDEYRGLLYRGSVRNLGEGEDTEQVGIAHHWLRGRKKGPLAQFVIGTVDQVLFAGLKSRHLMLRHLALAGKVVIIDEVHAYDVFMSRYLDRVLHWLGAYGTPVVLLSATLPAARRAELLAAHHSGRNAEPITVPDEPSYPLVWATGLAPRPVPASGADRRVRLARIPDDLDAVVSALRERLSGGGCAVIIRNTVGRVQETADRLVAEFGEDQVTVAHSRFLACDRARLDAGLLHRFGPPGPNTQRPDLHTVVASQVVEQSLDVDFDLMVTDLAPIDLVLQRLGRLHRHARFRPDGVREPWCLLAGVEDWSAAPVRAVSASRWVYSEHTLLRSAALVFDRTELSLPTDIAPLVQTGYSSARLGPDTWQDAIRIAQHTEEQSAYRRREEAGKYLVDVIGGPAATLDGWIKAGVGDADADPRGGGQVRDGAESLEVLVVQRDHDGGLLTPDWIGPGAGQQIPLDQEIPAPLARTVAACALRLPFAMSQMNLIGDGVIAALERNHYTSFDQTPLLSGQLVLVLDTNRSAELRHGAAAFRVTYNPRRGLLHEQLR